MVKNQSGGEKKASLPRFKISPTSHRTPTTAQPTAYSESSSVLHLRPVLANEPGIVPMFSRLKELGHCNGQILLLIKVAMIER